MTTLVCYLVVLIIITEAEERHFNIDQRYNGHNTVLAACSCAAAACEDEIPSSVCDLSLFD